MSAFGSATPGRGAREVLRKGIHVAVGGLALFLGELSFAGAVGLLGTLVIHNTWVLPRYGRFLWRPGEPYPFSPGITSYPWAALIAVCAFPFHPERAAALWALLAAGDGAAAVLGRLVPLARLPWNHEKSWGGLLGFWSVGTLASYGVLRFVAHARETEIASGWVVCTAVALAAAVAESVRSEIDDNLRIVGAGVVIFALFGGLVVDGWTVPLAIGVSGTFAALALVSRSVNVSGAVAGFLVAAIVLLLDGLRAFAVLASFVVLGVATTRWGRRAKRSRGLEEARRGRRAADHVVANLGVGALLVASGAVAPDPRWAWAAATAAWATAAFDTVSTEVGQLWGRRPVLVGTLRVAEPGTPGAVSWVGSVAGAVAACGVALVSVAVGWLPSVAIGAVVFCAAVGAFAESMLARHASLGHHTRNLSNTAIGAATFVMLSTWFGVV